MPLARVSQFVDTGITANYIGAGTLYPIETETGVLYMVYIDANNDAGYRKSTDYGVTWGSFVALRAGSTTNIACWYDGWSGITATHYIHVVYTDSGSDDTYYRTIDTGNSDTLGTERVPFAGASTLAGGTLSVTRARGGNVMVATCIDAGTEYDTRKTTDLGANWTSPAEVFEAATSDQIILLPDFNADNQDVQAIYWDADADEISVKRYDNSGDTWGETSIATSMVDTYPAGGSAGYPNFSASVDLANSQIILAAWSAVDSANADLRFWTITNTTITEKTNVVLNSTDDQAYCSTNIAGSVWTVIYAGKSDGTETYASIMDLYYKQSLDGGTTWGSETRINAFKEGCYYIYANPISYVTKSFYLMHSTSARIYMNIPNIFQRTNSQI